MTRMVPLLAFCFICLAGCGKKAGGVPALHEVSGTVCKKGIPVEGGTLDLIPLRDNPSWVVAGEIDSHGKISVYTIQTTVKNPKKNPGAPEGEYKVTYRPPAEDDENKAVEIEVPVLVSPGAANKWSIELRP